MAELFINFSTSTEIVVTVDAHVILYDNFENDSIVLDRLFKICSLVNMERVTIVTNGVYDTGLYSNAYNTGSVLVEGTEFFGSVSQLDLNKLISVLKAAKITDIFLYDKMSFYEKFCGRNQCVIDYVNDRYIIVIKQDEIVNITFSKEERLEQTLLQLLRKYQIDNVRNLTSLIEYDCVKYFVNYSKVMELPVYNALTVFGYFRYVNPECTFDIHQVKFDSKMNTVSYSNEDMMLNQQVAHESVEDVLPAEEEPVNAKKGRQKRSKKSHKYMQMNCILAALTLTLVVACVVTFIFKEINAKGANELLILSDKISRKELYIQSWSNPSYNRADVYEQILESCPEEGYLGSIVFSDTIEVLYYIQRGVDLEIVTDALSENFEVNATSSDGNIVVNDTYYDKYTISISAK